ncbi:MAG: ImmA/IrrE family metallo-endopeptidase [Cyanobacteria bacterium P01_D01_bin.6]
MVVKAKRLAINVLKKHQQILTIPPVDVKAIVKAEGLDVTEEDLEDEVSGLLVSKNGHHVIIINANHYLNRQRFTIAHELGHYLMHRNISNIFFDEALVFFRDKEAAEGTKLQEIEANAFAAELLMPESLLRKVVRKNPVDAFDDSEESLLTKTAKDFQVSVQALTIRLTRLGLISV